MPEHAAQNAIKEFLEYRKCLVIRNNAGKWQDSRTGSWIQGAPLGTPDLAIGVPVGRLFALGWLEIKSATGKLSMEQVSYLRRMHKLGCPWAVVESVDEVEKWLRDLFEYHGNARHADDVLNEDKRFIPTVQKTSKKQRLSMSTLNEFLRWSDKNGR